MKKISLLLALCLMLSIFAGCAEDPVSTTAATTVPTVPTETTAAPTEPTVPPTEPPAPKVVDYALDAPEGFFASVVQDTITVLTSPNAPMDTSTITVEVLPMNPDALTLSEAEFEAKITKIPMEETEPTSETSEATEATDPSETTEPTGPKEFDLIRMEQIEVDGWPTLVCEYELVFAGYTSRVLRYEAVVNEANYVFTFTDNTETGVWAEDFPESADSIDLILDSDGVELNYSNLTLYDLGCGLTIYAEDGMESHQAEGFTACIGNRNVIILLMADDKESNNLTQMEPEDYAELLRSTNELDAFKSDIYGNLFTTFYSTDETGMEYYNMICIKETDDDFWVVQLACAAEDQAAYAKAFNLWASSISEN